MDFLRFCRVSLVRIHIQNDEGIVNIITLCPSVVIHLIQHLGGVSSSCDACQTRITVCVGVGLHVLVCVHTSLGT